MTTKPMQNTNQETSEAMSEIKYIEAGKFYRNRLGEKVGPMILYKRDRDFPWLAENTGLRYTVNGSFFYTPGSTSNNDLIELWTDPTPPAPPAPAEARGEVDLPTMENTVPILIGDLLRRDDLYPDPNGYMLAIPENSIGERVFIKGFRRRIPAPVQESEIQYTHFIPAGQPDPTQAPIADVWSRKREEYRKAIEGLRNRCQEFEKRHALHSKYVDNAQECAVMCLVQCCDAKKERDKLAAKVKELEQVIAGHCQNHNAACESLAKYFPRESVYANECHLTDIAGFIDRLRAELAEARNEIASCGQLQSELKAATANAQFKMNETLVKSMGLEQQIAELQAELAEARNEIAMARTHKNAFKSELEKVNEQLAAMTEQRDKLADKFAKQAENFRSVSAKCSETIVERNQLQEQLAALKSEPEEVKWRELKVGEEYRGPGQVRDSNDDWQDAIIAACDNRGDFPFLAKVAEKFYSIWKFARVRQS